MDALFIIVAQLLIIPLILWALILLELTLGVLASMLSIFAGRRSLSDAMLHSWRTVRRRLLWSLIFLTSGLLLADLVLFETIVAVALRAADDREDLDVRLGHAEGSFILGRIELHQLEITGTRGGADPRARFDLTVDELVIDIDTVKLLTARFAVDELSVRTVRGSYDRLRRGTGEPAPAVDLAREFSIGHLAIEDAQLTLRDHTRETPRELEVSLVELQVGPVASESAVFDLLHRVRGRGSIAGQEFELRSTSCAEAGDPAPCDQTVLELRGLSLDALAEPLEQAAGVRAGGSADLTLTARYRDTPPDPRIDLAATVQLRELALEAGADASVGTRLMLRMAGRELSKLGAEFPLAFELSVRRSELLGLRSLAESGLIERVADAMVTALRDKLADP